MHKAIILRIGNKIECTAFVLEIVAVSDEVVKSILFLPGCQLSKIVKCPNSTFSSLASHKPKFHVCQSPKTSISFTSTPMPT